MRSFKLPRGKGEYYFILALGIILVIIVFGILVISFTQNPQPVQPSTQAPVTTSIYTQEAPTTTPQKKFHLNINAASQLVTREEQRIPLSQSDEQAKARALTFLPVGQNYGDVYVSQNIDIYYVQSLDLFEVEIHTIDVAFAKSEAESWFKQQGMSQQGICNLPLGFYLGSEPASILQQDGYIFNPLPDGC